MIIDDKQISVLANKLAIAAIENVKIKNNSISVLEDSITDKYLEISEFNHLRKMISSGFLSHSSVFKYFKFELKFTEYDSVPERPTFVGYKSLYNQAKNELIFMLTFDNNVLSVYEKLLLKYEAI